MAKTRTRKKPTEAPRGRRALFRGKTATKTYRLTPDSVTMVQEVQAQLAAENGVDVTESDAAETMLQMGHRKFFARRTTRKR